MNDYFLINLIIIKIFFLFYHIFLIYTLMIVKNLYILAQSFIIIINYVFYPINPLNMSNFFNIIIEYKHKTCIVILLIIIKYL